MSVRLQRKRIPTRLLKRIVREALHPYETIQGPPYKFYCAVCDSDGLIYPRREDVGHTPTCPIADLKRHLG